MTEPLTFFAEHCTYGTTSIFLEFQQLHYALQYD